VTLTTQTAFTTTAVSAIPLASTAIPSAAITAAAISITASAIATPTVSPTSIPTATIATAPDGSMHALPVLSLQAEREQLLETLHAAEREMSVRFETATTDALRAVMTMGTGILHWSGHGEEGSIAFEDGSGATHSLSPQSLADTCLAVRTEYVPTGLRVRVPLAADGEAWHATQRGVASMTTRRGILHVHSMRRGVWHATQRGNLPMY
jgi:hypothetical protein